MERGNYKILSNSPIAKGVYKIILQGDTSAITAPGQFVNIELPGLFLRRPISISDWSDDTITLIYKVVGQGTDLLSTYEQGQGLDLLVGLGNGFELKENRPLVIGGGVGVPPLYRLVKELKKSGVEPVVILGFNKAEEVFYFDEFKALGVDVYLTTVDGSMGIKGFVTDAIKSLDGYDYFYTCGPLPMIKALMSALQVDGQISMEERMGCGFGVCMGCSIQTNSGNKRVCKEGPVFNKADLIL